MIKITLLALLLSLFSVLHNGAAWAESRDFPQISPCPVGGENTGYAQDFTGRS